MRKPDSLVTASVLILGALQSCQLTATSAAETSEAKLIARAVLFGNPDKAAARISPDGKYLSFLAPVDGVMNVWVGPAGADHVRGLKAALGND